MIVQGAHAIRRGEAPTFAPSEQMRRDLFLIERPSRGAPRSRRSSRSCPSGCPPTTSVDPVRDIQVFAPVYRGELGIDALNAALRDPLNPDGRPVRGGRLRIGDKLMMTGRNLHDLGLMNGTLLRLLDETGGRSRPQRSRSERGPARGRGRLDPRRRRGTIFRLPPEQADRCDSRTRARCTAARGSSCRWR